MMTNPFSEKVLATSPPLYKAAGQTKKNNTLDQVPFAETLTKEINGKSAPAQLKASSEHTTKPVEDQQISSNADVTSSSIEEIKKPNFEQGGGNKELNNSNEVVALVESPKQYSDEQQETEKLTTALQGATSEQGRSQSWQVLLSVIRSGDSDQNGTTSMENSMGVLLVEEAVPNTQNKLTELDRLAEALINQQQHIAKSQGNLSDSQGLGNEKELSGVLAEAESQRTISASQGLGNEKELSGVLAEAEPQRTMSASQGLGNEKELSGILAEAESQRTISASQGLAHEKELAGLLAEVEPQNATSHGTKSIEKNLEGIKNSKSTESTPVASLSSGSEVTTPQSSSRGIESLLNVFNQQEDNTGASSKGEALIPGMKTNGGEQRISSPQGEVNNEVKLNSLNKVMFATDEQVIQEVLNKDTRGAQFASTAENNPSLEQVGVSKKESGIGLQKFSDVSENDVVQHSIPLTQLNHSPIVENRAKANETHTAASIFQQTITNLETLLKGDQKFLRIQLYPENLGGLEIKLSSQGGALQISIIADNAIAQQALERHAQELQQVLQQSGVNLTGLTINQRQAQQGTEQQHASHGKRRSQTWIQQSDDENIQAVIPSQMNAYSAVGSSRVDFFV